MAKFVEFEQQTVPSVKKEEFFKEGSIIPFDRITVKIHINSIHNIIEFYDTLNLKIYFKIKVDLPKTITGPQGSKLDIYTIISEVAKLILINLYESTDTIVSLNTYLIESELIDMYYLGCFIKGIKISRI